MSISQAHLVEARAIGAAGKPSLLSALAQVFCPKAEAWPALPADSAEPSKREENRKMTTPVRTTPAMPAIKATPKMRAQGRARSLRV